MVLVVSGSGCDPGGCSGERGAAGAEGWEEAAKGLLEAGLGVKEVALRINQEMGVPKNRVKELLLGLLRGNR